MLTKEAIEELVRDFVYGCDQYEYEVLPNNKIKIVIRWFVPHPCYDDGGSIDSVDFDVEECEQRLTIQEIQDKIEFRIWRQTLINELDAIKRQHENKVHQIILNDAFLNRLRLNNPNVYTKLHYGIYKYLWVMYDQDELPF